MKRSQTLGLLIGGVGSALRVPSIRNIASLLVILISLATAVYHFLEGWRWLDSFYFSVVTLATVGFGDFAPKTDAGKLFTVFLILSGFGLFVAVATAIADHIITEAKRRDREN